MAFKEMSVSGNGNTRPPKTKEDLVDGGMHVARLYGLCDVGTHTSSVAYKNQQGEMHFPKQRLLYFLWELPEIMEVWKEGDDPKPMSLKQKIPLAFGPKSNLEKHMKSWFSDNQPAGDVQTLLEDHCVGRTAYLNVSQKSFAKDGETIWYNSIDAISPLPKSVKCPKQINPSMKFDMFGKFDEEAFNKMPKWLQDLTKKTNEYGKCIGASILGDGTMNKDKVDDLPF